jgi:limonene-1,2-epoxide hydrolase
MASETPFNSSSEQVVLWVTGWPELGLPAAAADFFTSDAVFVNMPVQDCEVLGPVAIGESLIEFRSLFAAIEVEVLGIAEEEDLVLVERIERFVLLDGTVLEVDVIGAFELRDGLIAAWRDYWEVAEAPILEPARIAG